MEFTRAGDPPPRRVPSSAAMLAQFGQPVAVLISPPPGSTQGISGGAVDGQIWYIDVDYRVGNQLTARVRTIHLPSPPPTHGVPGHFLRSALVEFSVNAELTLEAAVSDPEQSRGMQLNDQQEKRATMATTVDGQMTIDGHAYGAVTLHIQGYRAYLVTREQSTVIYVDTGRMPAPELQITSTPENV